MAAQLGIPDLLAAEPRQLADPADAVGAHPARPLCGLRQDPADGPDRPAGLRRRLGRRLGGVPGPQPRGPGSATAACWRTAGRSWGGPWPTMPGPTARLSSTSAAGTASCWRRCCGPGPGCVRSSSTSSRRPTRPPADRCRRSGGALPGRGRQLLPGRPRRGRRLRPRPRPPQLGRRPRQGDPPRGPQGDPRPRPPRRRRGGPGAANQPAW
jgi:hypothetical protein